MRSASAAALLVLAAMATMPAAAVAQPARPLRVVVVPLSSERTACPAVANPAFVVLPVDGKPVRMPEWLSAPEGYAFLAIDENGNGMIDDASELVSNRMGDGSALDVLVRRATALQAPDAGYIDSRHPLFGRLLLWRDFIHNGRSDRPELQPLSEVLAVVGLGTQLMRGELGCPDKGWSVTREDWTGQPRPDDRLHPLWEVELRLDPAVAAHTRTSTPVVSASVSASPSPDGYIVRLTNNRHRPIEAWEVHITFENGGGLGQGHLTFPSEAKPGQPHAPIDPGETREIRFTTSRTERLTNVRVDGVLFDDMHFEGRHTARHSWLSRREAYGAEASDWLEALRAAAAATDPAAARGILAGKLAEHRQLAEDGARSHAEAIWLGIDRTMQQILDQTAARPDAWRAILEHFLAKFERDRQWAFRHR